MTSSECHADDRAIISDDPTGNLRQWWYLRLVFECSVGYSSDRRSAMRH
ncbi:MAG TPA: hypothetical protein VGL94_09910 [Ktedonobacteraceae bacterium]